MAKKKEGKKTLGGRELRATLKGDDTFLKYRRILKFIMNKMDFEALHEEINRLHDGRTMPNLHGTTPGAERIGEAVLKDVRARSRLVKLALQATRYHDMLEIVLDQTRKYLANQYGESAPSLRTKAERMSYFDQYLVKGLEVKQELKSLFDSIQFIIKDIDQAGFATRHLVDCLELQLNNNNSKQSLR